MSTASVKSRSRAEVAVRQSLELLHEPGSIFEVRCLGIPGRRGYLGNASGYFDDYERAAECSIEYDTTRQAKGIYTTINPCLPALLARANNRIVDGSKTATRTPRLSGGVGYLSILIRTALAVSRPPMQNSIWREPLRPRSKMFFGAEVGPSR